jgi:hypothetical protein
MLGAGAMSLDYARGELAAAVADMALGPDRLAERVALAWMFHLTHLEAEDFPVGLRPRFRAIRDAIGSVDQAGCGDILEACRLRLPSDQALKIAFAIVDLAGEVGASRDGRESDTARC